MPIKMSMGGARNLEPAVKNSDIRQPSAFADHIWFEGLTLGGLFQRVQLARGETGAP